jgi:hypothetical protein
MDSNYSIEEAITAGADDIVVTKERLKCIRNKCNKEFDSDEKGACWIKKYCAQCNSEVTTLLSLAGDSSVIWTDRNSTDGKSLFCYLFCFAVAFVYHFYFLSHLFLYRIHIL